MRTVSGVSSPGMTVTWRIILSGGDREPWVSMAHSVAHCVPNVSVCVSPLSQRETLARQTFLSLKMMKISLELLCLLYLTCLTHQRQRHRQNSIPGSRSSSFPACPEGREQPVVEPRRKVCSNVTECREVCEKEDCQTYYKYRKGLRLVTLIGNLSLPSLCPLSLSPLSRLKTENFKLIECLVWNTLLAVQITRDKTVLTSGSITAEEDPGGGEEPVGRADCSGGSWTSSSLSSHPDLTRAPSLRSRRSPSPSRVSAGDWWESVGGWLTIQSVPTNQPPSARKELIVNILQ